MPDDDHSAISAQTAKRLFADWRGAPAIVLAVSGGPDSIALMWLAARWRRALKRGPRLIAVTVDHGLRTEAAAEARDVKRLARSLDLQHRTVRWSGTKPRTGLPAAARSARYRLLAQAARANGATHILTAHTRDDQAETLLMRIMRGSGVAGLAAMARESDRDGVRLARPFLNVSKSQLIATLRKAKVSFADDPTNRDTSFTRPRLRMLMPALAAEGGDTRNLARLASRLARANQAVEVLVDGAERYLALRDRDPSRPGFQAKSFDTKILDAKTFDAKAFAALAEEIRLRLLLRAIDRFGHEGPAELGKVEALLSALDRALAQNPAGRRPKPRLKQTLAGALVSLIDGRIRVEPAPPRRHRAK
ncbi:tRNA lysidine(34) synthetase TilS [Bradyrhizobium erythrophlei]|jgi:tRNA(Ile)-lysidine synthase|uniref:tRNA(Ile)-lysidine synthase n=1 Tax=Bradyrhizobium erythrophlei TaxID=1437360 RepID=A0A1M5I1W8_9BRAD|nr:tRNA lysidine(34) synthetase TilS [Bradyrhizobium erythrophlei]SHG22245.1 tRNA(Ile)-lysidine synthase [Bradyrhizobium erythrophlei]